MLSEVGNEAIFATQQIRIFVWFMWDTYSRTIFLECFLPFVFNFISFITYASYSGFNRTGMVEEPNTFQIVGGKVCIATYFVTLLPALRIEYAQLKDAGWAYF